jgi:hypothetical protein
MTYKKKFDLERLNDLPLSATPADFIAEALGEPYDEGNPLHWLMWHVASAWGNRARQLALYVEKPSSKRR